MRILTVRQPWAWAIIHGGKNVENRVRNIAGAYRGPVAIHVAQSIAKVSYGGYHQVKSAGWGVSSPLHLGHIIGVVDLVDVHRANGANPGELNMCAPYDQCSPWAEPTGWHLVLANPRPLVEPIRYRGALGLRHLDDEMVARINAQIGGS